MGDIVPADVYQRHREPAGWAWPPDGAPAAWRVDEPSGGSGAVALKLALSATVTDDRIRAVLGDDAVIWTVSATVPGNDVLKRKEDLAALRRVFRGVFDRVKARHGRRSPLNVFPAMPVAAAVELGRVWMPKADLDLALWDEQRAAARFVHAFTIGRDGSADASEN